MSILSHPAALTGVLLAVLLLIPILFSLRQSTSQPAPGEALASAPDRENPRWWVAGIFYVNTNDSALLVKKRSGLGWTLNFGHWLSWLYLALLLAIPLLVRSAAAHR